MEHGRHIKVVGKGSPELMREVQGVRHFLEDMVDNLGMRCLGEPHIYEVEEEIHKMHVEPFEDEGGTTGIVVLSTSHCSIHTWPLRSFFVLDVYSCRDFEPGIVERALERHFKAFNLRVTDVSHSLEPLPELPVAESSDESGPRPVVQA